MKAFLPFVERQKKRRRNLWIYRHSSGTRWEVRIRLRGHLYYVGTTHDYSDAVILRNVWLRNHCGSLLAAWNVRRQNWRSRPKNERPDNVGILFEPFTPLPTSPLSELREGDEEKEVKTLLEAIEEEMGGPANCEP